MNGQERLTRLADIRLGFLALPILNSRSFDARSVKPYYSFTKLSHKSYLLFLDVSNLRRILEHMAEVEKLFKDPGASGGAAMGILKTSGTDDPCPGRVWHTGWEKSSEEKNQSATALTATEIWESAVKGGVPHGQRATERSSGKGNGRGDGVRERR